MKINKITLFVALALTGFGVHAETEDKKINRNNNIQFKENGIKKLSDVTASIYPIAGIIGPKSNFSTSKTALFYIDNSSGSSTVEYNIVVKKALPGAAYQETDEVKVFPSKLLVEAGNKYPVKVLLKTPAEELQKNYRVYFEFSKENKVNIKDNEGNVKTSKFTMPITISIPVYVQPAGEIVEQLEVKKTADGWVAENKGNVTYRISEIIADDKSTEKIINVLPKETVKLGIGDAKKVTVSPNKAYAPFDFLGKK